MLSLSSLVMQICFSTLLFNNIAIKYAEIHWYGIMNLSKKKKKFLMVFHFILNMTYMNSPNFQYKQKVNYLIQ